MSYPPSSPSSNPTAAWSSTSPMTAVRQCESGRSVPACPGERQEGERWVGTDHDYGVLLVNAAHESRRDLPVLRVPGVGAGRCDRRCAFYGVLAGHGPAAVCAVAGSL